MSIAPTPEARPVVVGVDGSAASMVAARWAAQEAAARDAPLRVVHVWSPPVAVWPSPIGVTIDPESVRAGALEVAEQAATEARRAAGRAGGRVEALAVQGTTVPTLLEVARDGDLLVVGGRGRGGFGSLLLGSVASSCAHHATVPVAAVRAPAPPGSGEVVVGVDDSENARTALRWAMAEAERTDRQLVVVHGWETPVAVPPGGMAYGPLADEDFQRIGGAVIDAVVADASAGRPEVPRVRRLAVPATAPEALIAAAEGAAMLVVGSRGRGGFAGLLLGSVSQQCLHHAPCPVVVVPPPDRARTDAPGLAGATDVPTRS